MMKFNTHAFLRTQFTSMLILGLCASASAQAPANDECSGAIAITPSTTTTCTAPTSGNGSTATMSATVNNCASSPSNDLWYSFQAGATAQQISLTNVAPTASNLYYYGYTAAVYSGTCGTLTELSCSDGSEDILSGDPATEINFTVSGLTVGATYYIQVAADGAFDDNFDDVVTGISFNVCVTMPPPPPANDECAGALFINSSGTTTVSNAAATQSMPPITCETYTASVANDIWFKFVPAATGNMTVNVAQSSIDAVWELFSGTCGNLTSIGCADEDGPIAVAATAGQTYYLRAYEYSDGVGNFTVTVGGVALPVQFVTLTGAVKNNYAALQWITAGEKNNKGFTVQRSDDGKNFSTVGYVPSLALNGSSEQKLHYTFDDRTPVYSSVFYRLQQTDIDGQSKLSDVVRLDAGQGALSIVAAPNPFKNTISINTYGAQGSDAVIRVMTLNGTLLKTVTINSAETTIDLNGAAAGMYIIQYTDSQHNETIKVNKL